MNVPTKTFDLCSRVACWFTVEYTPQAYLQSDLQMFARNFSEDLIDKEPYLVSIDGGMVFISGPRLGKRLMSS